MVLDLLNEHFASRSLLFASSLPLPSLLMSLFPWSHHLSFGCPSILFPSSLFISTLFIMDLIFLKFAHQFFFFSFSLQTLRVYSLLSLSITSYASLFILSFCSINLSQYFILINHDFFSVLLRSTLHYKSCTCALLISFINGIDGFIF